MTVLHYHVRRKADLGEHGHVVKSGWRIVGAAQDLRCKFGIRFLIEVDRQLEMSMISEGKPLEGGSTIIV
jgi:hypothetical protein